MKHSSRRGPGNRTKPRSIVQFRMNVLFFSIFILFSLLIFRLGYLQIVKGEEYVRALEEKEEVPVNTSVPRGRIYDKFGRILVGNEPKNAITYTKMQNTKQTDILEIAKQMSTLIEMDISRITLRDKQDFWILNNKKKAYKKVTDEEKEEFLSDAEISEKEAQQQIDMLVRERITEEELNSFSGEDLEVLAIFREMASGYALSPQIIKTDVPEDEFARVSERLDQMPGMNTTTDWERVKYLPQGSLSILGRTTTPQKGIPADKLDYFLARGYSRNDRVGESYLELQYEDLLQGQKTIVKNITNNKGQLIETVPVEVGKAGKDLILTIDSELQLELEEIVERNLLEMKKYQDTKYLDKAFLVMMDPNTGDVLSMVGKQAYKDEKGENQFLDYSYGTFTAAFPVGSVVKPATLLTAFQENIIRPGHQLVDEPIRLAGTSGTKSSVFNRSSRITIDDQYAIERSSNVYMFKVALLSAGLHYRPNMPLKVMPEKFELFRSGYSQFGLGVPTGIDLLNEATGVKGDLSNANGGNLLDLTIGQYDTYTTLQLAQYVSTIANNGNRVRPHVVKEIREPSEDGISMGPLLSEVGPNIINRLENTQIKRVKDSMRRVYIGRYGSARSWFGDKKYEAAGKTGTAQSFIYDPTLSGKVKSVATLNLTHIGYAPLNNPEIAYAVVVPDVTTDNDPEAYINNLIAEEAVDKYFELKNKNLTNGIMDEENARTIKPSITDQRINESIQSNENHLGQDLVGDER